MHVTVFCSAVPASQFANHNLSRHANAEDFRSTALQHPGRLALHRLIQYIHYVPYLIALLDSTTICTYPYRQANIENPSKQLIHSGNT